VTLPAQPKQHPRKAEMANYTAADVKRLRELTGAGMLDCKNALVETDGDFDKAVEALRIKGAKDVGKRAERATAEGLVAAKDGALVELNCETDFVAKNAEFQKVADEIVAAAAAAKAIDVDALKAAPVGDKTVEQAVAELSAKIGEKLELRRVAFFDGTVETYLHKRAADLPPAVGVLVEYQGSDGSAAHAVALQIAALKARYLSRDDVPDEVVASERRIAEETAKAEGKPEQALPKIVEGRLNGFFKDAVLLDQPSVSDNKKTVKALLDEAGVTVTRFVRFEVGQA
jgi:elongation factor Ts